MTRTIHDYAAIMERIRRKIREAPISEENKQLLAGFDQFCAVEGLSLARRTKLLNHLYWFATRFYGGDLRSAAAVIEGAPHPPPQGAVGSSSRS